VKVCPNLMRIRTVGLFFAQDIQVDLSLLQVSCGDKQVGQVHMRGIVVGSQLDSAGKFLVGTIEVSKLEGGFRELIVGLREAGIDMHGVGELNGRLAVLALGEIALSALKVLLFANIGITRATREQSSGERTDQQQADNRETTHDHFSKCSAECADKFPALERSIILHENRQAKVTAVIAVNPNASSLSSFQRGM